MPPSIMTVVILTTPSETASGMFADAMAEVVKRNDEPLFTEYATAVWRAVRVELAAADDVVDDDSPEMTALMLQLHAMKSWSDAVAMFTSTWNSPCLGATKVHFMLERLIQAAIAATDAPMPMRSRAAQLGDAHNARLHHIVQVKGFMAHISAWRGSC